MAKYVYPAIFTPAENNSFTVSFPDLKNCFTQGEDLADALEMAQDVLCLMIYDMEERGAEIPSASSLQNVAAPDDALVSLVACDTLEYRKKYNNVAVKKTLTIPTWLNTLAEEAGVNFSQTLQDALKEQLKIAK